MISDSLLAGRGGAKALKFGRDAEMPRLAETFLDLDEIRVDRTSDTTHRER